MPSGVRHATDEHIAFTHARWISRRVEPSRRSHRLDEIVTQVLEIVLAPLEAVDLALVDVKADDTMPRCVERAHQRQANVSQPDHTNHGRAIRYLFVKFHLISAAVSDGVVVNSRIASTLRPILPRIAPHRRHHVQRSSLYRQIHQRRFRTSGREFIVELIDERPRRPGRPIRQAADRRPRHDALCLF